MGILWHAAQSTRPGTITRLLPLTNCITNILHYDQQLLAFFNKSADLSNVTLNLNTLTPCCNKTLLSCLLMLETSVHMHTTACLVTFYIHKHLMLKDHLQVGIPENPTPRVFIGRPKLRHRVLTVSGISEKKQSSSGGHAQCGTLKSIMGCPCID